MVKKPNRKQTLKILVIAGAIALFGFLTWKYMDAKKELNKLSDSKNASQTANDELAEKVSKLTWVPGDEQPTVANVADANKLKDQALFSGVENGDKVLVYAKARRQILYRPSTNQIITAVTLPADSAPSNSD